jgi:creatinine amidohydrolase
VWDGRPDEVAAEIDVDFDQASWSENFPWKRLPGVEMPSERKPPMQGPRVSRSEGVEQLRERLEGDWAVENRKRR